MRDAKQRLRPLDRIDAPDVWHRAEQLEPIGDVPPGPKPSWQGRAAAGAVALAVFAGAITLVLGAFGDADPVPRIGASPSSATPSHTQAPQERAPIEVTTPVRGAEVSSPVTVAGTADVFEATVSIEILDGTNNRIAEAFATATCGSGCRGEFSVDVPFEVGSEQQGVIVVYELSAEDGTRTNAVRIPVTLVPGSDDAVAEAVEGVWSDAEGDPLPDGTDASRDFALVMHVFEGADHCGWTSVTFMNLGWPLGEGTEPPGSFRQYVRDPNGVLADSLVSPFGSGGAFPDDAAPTGFHRGRWELWTASSDVDEAVYVVHGDPRAGGTWERWPRATDVIACA